MNTDGDAGVASQRARPTPGGDGRLGIVAGAIWLWRPRWLGTRNRLHRLDRGGKMTIAAIAALAMLLWAVVFGLFFRALSYLLEVDEVGPLLTFKLLGMILMGFLAVLLFSNVISSLSTFYLSRDLDRLRSAPLSPASFFLGRFSETLLESSWMVLMLAVPAFLAIGVAHGAGPAYYGLVLVTLPPFLVVPAALGVTVSTLLVTLLPAQRTREVLWLFGILALAVVYMVLRMLRPERFLAPEGFGEFVDFLAELRTPSSVYLPSTWAAEILHPVAGATGWDAVYFWLLLVVTAGLLLLVCEWIVARLHPLGWSKAQEGGQRPATRDPRWEVGLRWLLRPVSVASRALVVKEVKGFLRDSSQWSQLILLFSLVVVYVYNFSVLPSVGGPLVTFYFRNVIAFLNLALAAFVTAAVAVRFVYPSISLEGRAFWVLKSAPIDVRRVWWAKFGVALLPMATLGLVLVVLTNSYLGVAPLMQWISVATMAVLACALVSLGLWAGAAYPRFDAENAAKISAGAGGVLYMTLCMLLIAAVVVLEAWPVYTLFSYRLSGAPMPLGVQAGVGASFAAAALLCVGVFAVSYRRGVTRLAALEI